MFPVKDRYDEVFEIEIDGWCFGLENYPGEVSAQIVHRIIRELASAFQAAVAHNVVFDMLGVAAKFSKASRYLIHEKELAFAIIAQLPNPSLLGEEEQCVLGMIIDQVEQAYGGALDNFYRRWQLGVKKQAA
jgi:hypothetical protein